MRLMLIIGALAGVACGNCPKSNIPSPPEVVFATTTVTCGTNKYEISVIGGGCQVVQDAQGNTTGGQCTDNKGNTASAECQSNGGDGSCGSTSGNGECHDTSRLVGDDPRVDPEPPTEE